jgi:protein required for attachment to host cells
MPLPHNALVLVADGRKMLFFRNHGDEGQIDLRTEAHDERADAKDSEMKTDAPGTAAHGAGAAGRGIGAVAGGHVGRPTMEETDYHQQEEDKWVKEAADELKKRALRNDYEALVIVAPPKALGVLRKELHKEVEKRIVCTVNKEMTDRPIPDIEALLVSETQTDELPAV